MLGTGEVIWEDGLITLGERYLATQIIKDRGLFRCFHFIFAVWSNRAFSLTWLAALQIYWNKRTFLQKKKVGSAPHRIGLGHQHGRRFIVSGHQYGGLDAM